MTTRDRNSMRKLQDRLLELPAVKQWEAIHGADCPIAGPGTPTVAELRKYLCPAHRELLERTISDSTTT